MADEKKMAEEELEAEETEVEETEGEETGGSENSGKEKGNDGSKGGKGGKEEKAKTFTQEQVNKMMTREKNQGRNSVYKELGINQKDTKAMKILKAFISSQSAGSETEEVDDSASKEAENRALVAEAKVEAMMQGVNKKYVEDIVTLALAKLTDDSDLKTIIGEFKTKYPVWFDKDEEEESAEEKKGKVGKKGTGSSLRGSKEKEKGKEKESGLGARLAAQRKSSMKKSSYWGNNK